MAKQLFSNNVTAYLASSLLTAGTSLTVGSGQGAQFNSPTNGDYELATLSDGTNMEIVKITARATDVLTVVRAQEGTTARDWASGTTLVYGYVTKGTLARLAQNEATGTDALALSGTAGGASDVAVGVGANTGTEGSNVAVGYSASTTETTIPAWQASHGYFTWNTLITDGAGHLFLIIETGTSGASAPTWNTSSYGAATVDGSVTWAYVGTVFTGPQRTAVGEHSLAYAAWGTVFGAIAIAGAYGVAAGASSFAGDGSVAIGQSAQAAVAEGLAVGGAAQIGPGSGYGAVAVGPWAWVDGAKNYCAAFGADAVNRIENSYVITGLPIARKDNGEAATNEHMFFTGSEGLVLSKVIDLKTLGDDVATITLPTGATFYPDEFGVILTAAAGVTVQPEVSSGITGNTTAVLAQTATTKAAAKGRDVFTPVKDGVNSLTASVKVAATATTLTGRFYWKGILVEDQ